jgi:hypothetical protein
MEVLGMIVAGVVVLLIWGKCWSCGQNGPGKGSP